MTTAFFTGIPQATSPIDWFKAPVDVDVTQLVYLDLDRTREVDPSEIKGLPLQPAVPAEPHTFFPRSFFDGNRVILELASISGTVRMWVTFHALLGVFNLALLMYGDTFFVQRAALLGVLVPFYAVALWVRVRVLAKDHHAYPRARIISYLLGPTLLFALACSVLTAMSATQALLSPLGPVLSGFGL
jgi:hypothetical protein